MLKQTPLNDVHRKLGARMVEFGGWEMPVQYKGVLEEHRAVRNQVGLFDISHMGELLVTGPQAKDLIQYLTTNDLNRIGDGQCQYSPVCYEDAGVVDDIISYQYNSQKYFVVVNASNTDKDFEWFSKNNPFQAEVQNVSSQYCQLALQGPLAEKVLQPLVDFPLSGMKAFTFRDAKVAGKPVILSRTGYTGEDGFEIYGAWNEAPFFWNQLMEAGKGSGIQPIGLAARDTLRLESAMSLYGHEIDDKINPLEARLGWTVKLDKPGFIGQKSLQNFAAKGIKRKLVGLEMIDAGIPRQGYEVVANEKNIGFVTSGTFSPTLEKPVAMALVESSFSGLGTEILIQIRKNRQKAKVIALPFYKRKA